MSNPPTSKTTPQKRKSAARLASEANTRQQLAVRTNAPRPDDRRSGDPQGSSIETRPRRPLGQ
jgi:hypothetical protein